MNTKRMSVSYQGLRGAYSHLACQHLFPDSEVVACRSFEDAIERVSVAESDYAVIPVENAIGGRVADVHNLLPKLRSKDLWICKEHFQPIDHCLLGIEGSKLADLRQIFSHEQALMQCRSFLLSLADVESCRAVDTAGAAMKIAQAGNKSLGAIASRQAATEYALDILQENIAETADNHTRFLVICKGGGLPKIEENKPHITSFVFVTRSIPAALYKCLGGFATNGINFLRLESYVKTLENASFYAEIASHPEADGSKRAFEELSYFTDRVDILGVYEISDSREK